MQKSILRIKGSEYVDISVIQTFPTFKFRTWIKYNYFRPFLFITSMQIICIVQIAAEYVNTCKNMYLYRLDLVESISLTITPTKIVTQQMISPTLTAENESNFHYFHLQPAKHSPLSIRLKKIRSDVNIRKHFRCDWEYSTLLAR